MDIDYQHLLETQRATLRRAQSRQGQPVVLTSRDELVMKQLMHSMMRTARTSVTTSSAPPEHMIKSSFIPPAYSPCTKSMEALKKVMIGRLTLETHHRGSYLLLRALTPPNSMNALMVVVEDEAGDALLLQLYHHDDDVPMVEYLREGRVIIVKEPYLKIMADGNCGLRVDHLSDVLLMMDHDERIPKKWTAVYGRSASADECKLEGNRCFGRGSHWLAIESYCKGLKSHPTEQEQMTIRLNLALTNLRSYRFNAALADVDLVLSSSPISEKALFRKAQALYNLRRFEASSEVFRVLVQEYPANADAKRESQRAIRRLAEQESGVYPFKQLQLEATKRTPPCLDRATFVGPVNVRLTPSRGQGLFTTAAVQAGDLLLCEKAFAFAHNDEKGTGQTTLLINPETNTITMGTQADLLGRIVRKLFMNPSSASAVTDLFHGSYESVGIAANDSAPVVDTFLAERIVALNAFNCKLSSRNAHMQTITSEIRDAQEAEEQSSSSGLWPWASRINHSCDSNVRRSFIGDMMIVRATRDLAADTELVFWYKKPSSLDSVNSVDLSHWKFKCTCRVCEDHEQTPRRDLQTRRRLWQSLKDTVAPGRRSVADLLKFERIMPKIETTYRKPPSEIPRFGLWDPYLMLAMNFTLHNKPEKAISYSLKGLESLGYVVDGAIAPYSRATPLQVRQWGIMTDGVVSFWMILARVFQNVATPDRVQAALGYARLSYRICVGEDETFDKTYGLSAARVDGLLA